MSSQSYIRHTFHLLLITLIACPEVVVGQNTADSLRAIINSAADDQTQFENRILLARTLHENEPKNAFTILQESYQEATSKNHPAVVDISYALAEVYEKEKLLDSAIIIYEQTRQLAQQYNNQSAEVRSLIDQGYLYSVKNELQRGLNLNKAAYEISKDLDNPDLLSRATNSLGRSYSFLGKFDSSSIYLQQAIDLQREKLGNDARIIFQLKMNIGNNYGRAGNFDQAQKEYEEGLELIQAANDSSGICSAYRNMGAAYYFSGEYPAALEVLQKAVTLLEGSDFYQEQITNLDFLGDVYLAIEDYENAGNYWQKAADLWQVANNDQDSPDLLFKVGRVRLLQNESEEALDLFVRAEQLKKEQGQFVDGDWYRYLGQAHQGLKNFDEAEKNYERAIELAPISSQQFTKAQCLLGLGEVSEARQLYSQAKSYYQQAEQASIGDEINELRMNIAAGLYRMYKQEGNSGEALRFLERSKMIQDSLFNRKNVQAIGRLQAENEFEQEKRELAFTQAQEAARQTNIRRILWGALALATLLLLIGTLYFRSKQKANKQLSKLNTEIQQQKEKLEELDESKSRFFTNISHEFRTPLTIIKGMVEKIREKPEVHLEKGSSMIRRNTLSLLDLVNQILDLRKLEAKELQLNLKQGEVISYLRFVTESYQSYAEQKGLFLNFEAETPSLIMDYDADKLLRIVSNLLSNAVKFTSSGGRIDLLVRESKLGKKDALSLIIKDTGIGIENENLPNIFDRFYQEDDSTTRKQEGTGIGLSLTRELVQLMNGVIEVKSEPKRGTTFTVLLPITKEAEQSHSTASGDIPEPISSDADLLPGLLPEKILSPDSYSDRPKLLIVEDNPDVQQYMALVLADYYDIELADNGALGIEKAIETIPDLIISDVMMPEVDGNELTQTLKQDERTNHIPIILLTAKSDSDSKISGLEMGADAYLSKPFEERELFVRIDKMLELRRNLQQRYANFTPGDAEDLQRIENPFLQKMYGFLEDKLADADLDMEQLSKGLGMSRTQVFRKVKALTGQAPTLFIRSVRLKKGKQLLETTDLTISEVAYEVGFTSLSYFSTAFLAEFGIRPSNTRKYL
ncbi:MAG: tetratricopeptide repeat protein [Bacteroidota bacterium]